VFKNGGETAELWIHHQDGQGDTSVSKFYPLVSYGHCDGIAGVGLQRLGNFQGAASIARGFDHGDDLGGRFKIGPEVIQVVHQGIQINFQHRFMDFQGETLAHFLKSKSTGPFDQDGGILQLFQEAGLQQPFSFEKEMGG